MGTSSTPARAACTRTSTSTAKTPSSRWPRAASACTAATWTGRRAVEIKIGQGAKPGIGGHLPGEKVTAEIAATRMIPRGHRRDLPGAAPRHLLDRGPAQLIYALKEATNYSKPVGVKIAAVHNVAAIASGIVRAGADIVALDGFRGGTGAAPKIIRDHVGIPIEVALAAVDERLREEGIRHRVSLIASGGIRSSADVVKAIALGADAVSIGTAALVAVGCTLCQACHTGRCAWGLTTQDEALTSRAGRQRGGRAAGEPPARLERGAQGDARGPGHQRRREPAGQPRALARHRP